MDDSKWVVMKQPVSIWVFLLHYEYVVVISSNEKYYLRPRSEQIFVYVSYDEYGNYGYKDQMLVDDGPLILSSKKNDSVQTHKEPVYHVHIH